MRPPRQTCATWFALNQLLSSDVSSNGKPPKERVNELARHIAWGLVTPATWMRKDHAHVYEVARVAAQTCNLPGELERPREPCACQGNVLR
jgi:hypothetical protein